MIIKHVHSLMPLIRCAILWNIGGGICLKPNSSINTLKSLDWSEESSESEVKMVGH